jgi:hypothetical protein
MKLYFTKLAKEEKFYFFRYEKLKLRSGTKYFCLYFFGKYLLAVEL